MTSPNTTPPGWYPNQHGQSQWWDGEQWGQLAPPAPIVPFAQSVPVMYVRPQKDVGIAYLFALLLGGFSAHRLYLGRIGSAILFMALWFGGALLAVFIVGIFMMIAAFIWWVVDLCILPSMVRQANGAVAPGEVYPAIER